MTCSPKQEQVTGVSWRMEEEGRLSSHPMSEGGGPLPSVSRAGLRQRQGRAEEVLQEASAGETRRERTELWVADHQDVSFPSGLTSAEDLEQVYLPTPNLV